MMLSLMAAAWLGAGPEALLLGVREKNGLATYFVTSEGATRLGNGLAVPSKEGFAKLQLIRTRFLQEDPDEGQVRSFRDRLFTGPGKPARLQEVSCSVKEETVLTPLFVNADWISYERHSVGAFYSPCGPQGRSYPAGWAEEGLETIPLHEANLSDPIPSKGARPIGIAAVLGSSAAAALTSAGNLVLKRLPPEGPLKACKPKDLPLGCLGEPFPYSWALIRRAGRWQVRGLLNYLGDIGSGDKSVLYDVPADPAPLVGPQTLPRDWSGYRKESPGLVDLFIAPGGSFETRILPKRIEVWLDGKRSSSLEAPGAVPIMALWATDPRTADQWRSEATRILAP